MRGKSGKRVFHSAEQLRLSIPCGEINSSKSFHPLGIRKDTSRGLAGFLLFLLDLNRVRRTFRISQV